MKKIYYIANVRLPTEKAHGIQIMEMCQALADLGNEVELWVPKRKNSVRETPFDYYGVEKNFRLRFLPCLDLVRFGKWGFILESFTFAVSAFGRAILKKGFFYSRDEVIVVMLKLIGKKVAWETHMGHTNFFVWLVDFLKTRIVAISEGLRQRYMKKGEEKRFLVAPDGVNLNKFNLTLTKEEARMRLGLESDKKIILYSGHLYNWKGVGTLAEAARQAHNNWQFFFIGGSDKHIGDFRKRYAGTENIHVLGRKPLSEIPFYLKAADVLVLPNSAQEDISRLYTSPMKLFEYMASGTPIVASDLPSLREVLNEERAYFFQADSAESLVSTIGKVMDNEGEAAEKASKAHERVQNYTWEKRSRKILEFIS
jgi:glycosyltransferase involved in cell wall biosynthesis